MLAKAALKVEKPGGKARQVVLHANQFANHDEAV